MKKLMFVLFIFICILVFQNKTKITEYIFLNYVYKNEFNYINDNEYKKEDFYFKSTTNYLPDNKEDILRIIYTSLNIVYDKFNFFCKNDYSSCWKDVETLLNDEDVLSVINNFIHPFNSYERLNVSFNGIGKISVSVDKQYNENDIIILNNIVNEIYESLITDNMSDSEKIRVIHDYIIENTKYDKVKADDLKNNTNNSIYSSDTAYGPLIEGYGICSGYTDAMALFLNKMNIPNYKISSKEHVWNYVYVDGKWLHLDLTWDDPVIIPEEDRINHDYFLITTNELLEKETEEHNFNKNIFEQKPITNS